MIGHGYPVGAFFYFKKGRVTGSASKLLCVYFMIVMDDPLVFAKIFRSSVNRDVTAWPESGNPDVAAGTLTVGSKGFFAVMAGSAILPLIEGLHIEIFLPLNFQGFHFK